jgi:hypothetical protein
MIGAPGTVAGTIEFDGLEGRLFPLLLIAITVKVEEIPFVNPVTVQ